MNDRCEIKAYQTHYEITNYQIGSCKKLENMFCTWDPTCHKREEFYYFDENSKTLYIPRGVDPYLLETLLRKPVQFMRECNDYKKVKYTVNVPPRGEFQKEIIRFLTGTEEYHGTSDQKSQLVLSVPTRSGKTYCSIAAASILGCRAMVVVHRETLREQWASDILKYTKLKEENIVCIESSKQLTDMSNWGVRKLSKVYVIIVAHRTIGNIIKNFGFQELNEILCDLSIGLKIVDEAHLEYRNTLILDYATNVWKTFYLTATFARGDVREDRIFQNSFNHIVKMSKTDPEREKNVILIGWLFSTQPNSYFERTICHTNRGFNRFRYIEYEMTTQSFEMELRTLMRFLLESLKLEGRIVILSSKVESCEFIRNIILAMYPEYSVCSYNSDSKDIDYNEYGVVCTTPGMLGTGVTIKDLRAIINTEPSPNMVNMIQYFGRLDKYKDMDLYYICLWDIGFHKVSNMYHKVKKVLGERAKDSIDYDRSIVRY